MKQPSNLPPGVEPPERIWIRKDQVENAHVLGGVGTYFMRPSKGLGEVVGYSLDREQAYEAVIKTLLSDVQNKRRGYEQEERVFVAKGDGNSAAYFDGKATALMEVEEMIETLEPFKDKTEDKDQTLS